MENPQDYEFDKQPIGMFSSILLFDVVDGTFIIACLLLGFIGSYYVEIGEICLLSKARDINSQRGNKNHENKFTDNILKYNFSFIQFICCETTQNHK